MNPIHNETAYLTKSKWENPNIFLNIFPSCHLCVLFLSFYMIRCQTNLGRYYYCVCPTVMGNTTFTNLYRNLLTRIYSFPTRIPNPSAVQANRFQPFCL